MKALCIHLTNFVLYERFRHTVRVRVRVSRVMVGVSVIIRIKISRHGVSETALGLPTCRHNQT